MFPIDPKLPLRRFGIAEIPGSESHYEMNIAEIILKLQDISDTPFDAGTFAFQLVEAYAPPKATLAKLKQGSLNKATKNGDLLWAKKLHFRPATKGAASDTLDNLSAEWKSRKNFPRLLVSSDGDDIVALDTKLDDPLSVSFGKLTERYDFFLPLAGIERYQGVPDNPADIKASGRLAKFYDAILAANPDWTGHSRVHELNIFLTRILLCMFAQSTGIFRAGLFSQMLVECTSMDGSDTHEVLAEVFRAMNLREAERTNCPEYAIRFPYVNGGLFRDQTAVPCFSLHSRRILIDAAKLNWSEINPDIFGSMIQAVVKPEMRDELGMHYTSVPNIMKVLCPLFLDSLREELTAANGDAKRLSALLERIRRIRVFDPACGSGNFLIIAYKELCKLEMEVFELLKLCDRQFKLPLSQVRFENFTGIELEDFAVETAKLSLYIAQHQMNILFEQRFAFAPPALPLRDAGRIVEGNAITRDWESICPVDAELETYIVGNPPYLGMHLQNDSQKADLAKLFKELVRGYKELDYVACWFLKAARYCERSASRCALVSTNSICQGELVALLWPLILTHGLEIGFAHQSFKWKNNASNNAGVTCAIIGLRPRSNDPKYIFNDDLVRRVKHISPYLIEGDDTIVYKRSRSISGLPHMVYGNKPTDGGNLILSPEEANVLRESYPLSDKFLRRYIGSQEFIRGIERWCLWIEDEDLDEALAIPPLARRIERVRTERLASDAPSTVDKAASAHRFIQIQDYGKPALVIPGHSSENRDYLPVGWVDGRVIISNALFALYEPEMMHLALLSSRLNKVWLAAAGGRIKSDFRYSNTMVWNTFPVPILSTQQRDSLEEMAWAILAERERHVGKTLAELYNPEKMPDGLLSAHRETDVVLESIYYGRPFNNDTDRLEFLFKRYRLMVAKEQAPLLVGKKSSKVKVKVNG